MDVATSKVIIADLLNLYYNQTQSRLHPKRGTASTKVVLQSSTMSQHPKRGTASTYAVLITVKHSPGRIRNEALPVLNFRNEALTVLKLYYNQAQSSQHPKRGTASTQAAV